MKAVKSAHDGRDLLVAIVMGLCTLPAVAADRASQSREKGTFLGGLLLESRIVYPLQDSGWTAQGEQLHQPQGAGVSVFYEDTTHPGRHAQVLYLPVGLIPQADYEMAVTDMRAALASDEQSYALTQMGDTRRFAFQQPTRDGGEIVVSGRSFELAYTYDGAEYVVAAALLWTRLYLVQWQVRAPAASSSRTELRKVVEQMAARMVLQTEVVSTGQCWMPMKIEAVRPGKRRLRGQLATIAIKEGGIVRVMPDRLLVPGSLMSLRDLDTAALMYVGMGFAGRLIDGCVSPVDLNLDVPEGRREIRMEYGIPALEDDRSAGNRLRSSGSDIG